MSVEIRNVQESDLDDVLTLNNTAGPTIIPLDIPRLRRLFDTAEYFRVALIGGVIRGFIVGFGSGSAHDSSNFRWFQKQYPAFFYIDRIVVGSDARGGGMGRILYADAESYAESRYPQFATEVLMDELADQVLLFHGSLGFREVGQTVMPDAHCRVSLLMKPLYSYEWVHARYGDTLPDVPWILRPRTQATHSTPNA